VNYKETLFFIGKCLTIPSDDKNFKEASRLIKTKVVDWDEVVKLSTAHYVFTTLYCRFLSSNLLPFLPEDLVAFMKQLTEINRDRNQQIIDQAKEINILLQKHDIHPVFLKGTGNLLEELYHDIGERMVGDIDFIIRPEDYEDSIKILKKSGYKKVYDHDNRPAKHYPRLFKEGSIAAIEIHKEIVKSPFESAFNYETIKDNVITKNGFSFLGFEDQLALSIIAKQINDDGQYFNGISLRNAFDVYCLSQKVDALNAIKKLDQIFHPLNNFLTLCHFAVSNTINYLKNDVSSQYLATFDKLMTDDKYRKKHHKKWKRKLFWRLRLGIVRKSFYRNDYRVWLFRTITSKRWLQAKFKSAS
jgi:hypothetical protein